MYLLDTNHCIYIISGVPEVLQKLRQIREFDISTCDIVRGELIFMAYNSKYKQQNLSVVNDFLEDIGIYSTDAQTSDIYGYLKSELFRHFGAKQHDKRQKIKIEKLGFSDNDVWIAAITMRNNLTLVSSDSDFARMNEVETIEIPLEDWKISTV